MTDDSSLPERPDPLDDPDFDDHNLDFDRDRDSVLTQFADIMDSPSRPESSAQMKWLARECAAFYFDLLELGMEVDSALSLTDSLLHQRLFHWHEDD